MLYYRYRQKRGLTMKGLINCWKNNKYFAMISIPDVDTIELFQYADNLLSHIYTTEQIQSNYSLETQLYLAVGRVMLVDDYIQISCALPTADIKYGGGSTYAGITYNTTIINPQDYGMVITLDFDEDILINTSATYSWLNEAIWETAPFKSPNPPYVGVRDLSFIYFNEIGEVIKDFLFNDTWIDDAGIVYQIKS